MVPVWTAGLTGWTCSRPEELGGLAEERSPLHPPNALLPKELGQASLEFDFLGRRIKGVSGPMLFGVVYSFVPRCSKENIMIALEESVNLRNLLWLFFTVVNCVVRSSEVFH